MLKIWLSLRMSVSIFPPTQNMCMVIRRYMINASIIIQFEQARISSPLSTLSPTTQQSSSSADDVLDHFNTKLCESDSEIRKSRPFFPNIISWTSIIFRYYSLQLRNSQPLPHNFHLTFSLLNEFASFFKAKIHKIRSNISPHTFTIYSTLRTHISNQIVLRTQCLNSIRSI